MLVRLKFHQLWRPLIATTLLAILPQTADAADYTIKAGSASRSITVMSRDGDAPSAAYYVRERSTMSADFLSTELTNIDDPYSSGKWKVYTQNGWGAWYRLDIPDAAIAAGKSYVDVLIFEANGIRELIRVDLVGYDPTVANLPANVTQFNGSNVPSSGGRPEVNVSHVSGDSTAADNAEKFFDGTGYGPLLYRGAIVEVESQTEIYISADVNNDDAYNGCTVVLHDEIGATENQAAQCVRTIIDYNGGSHLITLDAAPDFVVGDGWETIEILAPGFAQPDRIRINDIKTKTDFLPSAMAGAAGGLFIAGPNAATTVAGLTSTAGITVTQSTTNGNGVTITGNDTGSGLALTRGGASGDDLKLNNSDAPTLANVLWDEARSSHTTSGTFGQGVASVQGNVTGSVGSISGVTFPENFSGLSITGGRVNADVTHWLGTEVMTNVDGVPRVDITHVLGSPVCD